MESWHFLEGFLILVSGDRDDDLLARTFEEGHLITCRLAPGQPNLQYDAFSSPDCKHALSDAIMQRRSSQGFKSPSDILSRIMNRYQESTHEADGLNYKLERETNGDYLASVHSDFDHISLRLTTNGFFEEPTGSHQTGGFDPKIEKIYSNMKVLLHKRRDWELISKLAAQDKNLS